MGVATAGVEIANVTIARHGARPAVGRPVLRNPAVDPLPLDWGVNVSFEDGHAARVKLTDLWTLRWNRTWVPSSGWRAR